MMNIIGDVKVLFTMVGGDSIDATSVHKAIERI